MGGLKSSYPYKNMPHRLGFKELIEKHVPDHADRNFRGIEIGCFRGEFCSFLLNEFQSLSLVTIDPSPYWDDVISNRKILQRLWILNFPSDKAIQFLDGQFEFVFIDGDHSYEQTKRDIINYSPLVKSGGLIAGHNFHKSPNSAHPGVHQAVEEVFGENYKLQPDFIWYVQKQ